MPDNYREVTVMPCIGKLFESVLNNILLKMMYVMIMIPFKPVLEVTPGQLIIYLYYFNVIKSMFSKAECRVKWDSCICEILKSEFGVLQGGMLSPEIFTEFLQAISKSFDQGQGYTEFCVACSNQTQTPACIQMPTVLPAKTRTWPDVVSMLVQRHWRWANIETTLDQNLVFAVLHTGVCLHPTLPLHNIFASRSRYF